MQRIYSIFNILWLIEQPCLFLLLPGLKLGACLPHSSVPCRNCCGPCAGICCPTLSASILEAAAEVRHWSNLHREILTLLSQGGRKGRGDTLLTAQGKGTDFVRKCGGTEYQPSAVLTPAGIGISGSLTAAILCLPLFSR